MASMREKWTDVDRRFEQVDRRFDHLERNLEGLRVEMGSRFERVDARLDSVQRTMLQGAFALSGAVLAGFGGMIALVASQL